MSTLSLHRRCFVAAAAFITGFILIHAVTYAEERSIRHELRAGLQWFHEDAEYSDYSSFGEARPLKSESVEKQPLSVSGAYTFFLTPLVPQPDTPARLWAFYQRPTRFSFAASYQPASRITNVHDDPALGYRRDTATDERLRTLSFSGEHYIVPNTGVSASLTETLRQHDGLARLTTGAARSYRDEDHESLRRSYGIGLSQYLNNTLRLRATYARLDGEYQDRDRSWSERSPHLMRRQYDDATLTGHHIALEGRWQSGALWGLRAAYAFQDARLAADIVQISPTNIAEEALTYDDDMTQHSLAAQIDVYPTVHLTIWAQGAYTVEAVRRTYADSLQTLDVDRQEGQIGVGAEYEIRRNLRVEGGYGYEWQWGDVAIDSAEHPTALASYDIERARHSLTLSIIARL